MNTSPSRAIRATQGFSLVEMIGVLAVVAILVSLILPRLFDAIGLAHVTATVSSVMTMKNAAMTYYGRYGRFGSQTGQALTSTNDPAALDWGTQVLLKGGFVENRFRTPIAQTSVVRLRPILSAGTAPTTGNSAYNLDGFDPAVNDSREGRWVVEAFLEAVSIPHAQQLNLRIDGEASTLADDVTHHRDTQGRVKFDASGTTCDVLIYLAHR